jgi:DNA-binding CsgD family transcriptional regulator
MALKYDTSSIARLHAKGMTDAQIAARLGYSRRQTAQVRRRLGLAGNLSVYRFTDGELQTIRKLYNRVPAVEIARALGRHIQTIYDKAKQLGLAKHIRFHSRNPAFVEFVKAKNAEGWSDAETAAAWPCERHCVQDLRHKLGLPHNAFSEHRRRQVAEKTAEQLRKAGLTSIGQLRAEAHKKFARDRGWPEDLKFRQVQILELLWKNGPMTREQLALALGLTKKPKAGTNSVAVDGQVRWWYPMHCNTRGHHCDTSYTGDLLRRGLLVTLGRIVRNKGRGPRGGQGRNTYLYTLPLSIERKPNAQTG